MAVPAIADAFVLHYRCPHKAPTTAVISIRRLTQRNLPDLSVFLEWLIAEIVGKLICG
jgi:hypothetical protein